jgi:hypothetical protein
MTNKITSSGLYDRQDLELGGSCCWQTFETNTKEMWDRATANYCRVQVVLAWESNYDSWTICSCDWENMHLKIKYLTCLRGNGRLIKSCKYKERNFEPFRHVFKTDERCLENTGQYRLCFLIRERAWAWCAKYKLVKWENVFEFLMACFLEADLSAGLLF